MAFAFFRRRQKLVIIIMAVLMVTFLIGFQGFQQFVQVRPEAEPRGTSRWGDVLQGEVAQAHSDVELLRMVGLGRSFHYSAGVPTETQFRELMRNDPNDVPLVYALLLKEAQDSGTVAVTDDDVEAFLESIGLTGAQYESFVAQLGDRRRDGGELLRGAIGRWLTITSSFGGAQPSVMPSEPEMRAAYRDLSEQINLRVGEFRAADLVDEIDQEPKDEDVLAHYNRYRTKESGRVESPEEFGFGYRRPNRVGVSYLFVDREVVERVARPSRARVYAYWQQNRDEFVREVPVETETDEEPTEYRREQMSFSEAEPLILEKLAPEAVEAATDALIRRAETLLDQVDPEADPDPYVQVRRRMVRSAEAVLDLEVTVRIVGQPLHRAIETLAEAAGLDAICYPWGDRGDIFIDPGVEISLPVEQTVDVPLGEVLDSITRQILGEADSAEDDIRIDWAHSAGLENVLFPVDGDLEMFPVSAERTNLVSLRELLNHELLGNAYTARQGGDGLWQRAFGADAFRPDRGTIRAGDTGPRMFVRNERSGLLLWRLSEAVVAHDSPEAAEIDDIPADLLDTVRADLKIKSAMGIARRRAERVLAEVDEHERELTEALADAGARVFETGLFSRMTYGLEWRGIPQMRTGGQEVLKHMAEMAFDLAPADAENDTDGDQATVKLVDLPPRHSVAVLERIGYSPATKEGYERDRTQVAFRLARRRMLEATMEWFDSDNVIRRGRYVDAREPADGNGQRP